MVRDTLVSLAQAPGIRATAEHNVGCLGITTRYGKHIARLPRAHVLLPSWSGGRSVCVDVAGVSALAHTDLRGLGEAARAAAHDKKEKYVLPVVLLDLVSFHLLLTPWVTLRPTLKNFYVAFKPRWLTRNLLMIKLDMASTHLAAVLPSRGADMVIMERPTPTPGANEVLIEVSAVALNPIDMMQRKSGFPSINYPAVLGSDVSGTVIAVGPTMPADAPVVGTRVAAFCPAFFVKGKEDYGAFQKKVIVPVSAVVAIPDTLAFNEAAILPMAVQTSWAGFIKSGLTRTTSYTPEDKRGLLVWGASSSVGSAAVQIAKSMGFTVYGTASPKNHEYIKSLGASRMFDYNDKDIVATIVKAGKEDGLMIDFSFVATGDFTPVLSILKELKKPDTIARIALAPFALKMLWWSLFPQWRSTEVKFVSMSDKFEERSEFSHFIFGVWLKDKLASGQFVASPKIKLIEGGLGAIQKALDVDLKKSSAEKLVVPL
ncbi:hypothetical protein SmJEL517_g04734 [Synchytrium microbalum]|uniref:Enoyl reductase (ER) domain-containing protein n=1 Tax=Synchytrium microbalum TaxID=1806994 RepID=A0A507BY95_9FUNG|nr:uncharacterized protein SmJEL517_g04734 [Synchytrium microbalum]TPX32081.1 hypothetical protein SmJEL517_g04734 [Synchytrium microbalum]